MTYAAVRRFFRPLSLIVVASALSGIAGCGPAVWKGPEEAFRGYPVRQQKIDLRVALRLVPEFRESKWEKKDCCVMPVGPSLAVNAEALAKHLFREVAVVSTNAGSEGVDATLTPRLVYVVRTVGACGPCESIIALKVEWRLVRSNGQPIWIETVGGQATGSTGGNPEKVLKAALEDLFLKSERAMTDSRAIHQVATKR